MMAEKGWIPARRLRGSGTVKADTLVASVFGRQRAPSQTFGSTLPALNSGRYSGGFQITALRSKSGHSCGIAG